MSDDVDLPRLLASGDLDELVRAVDRLAARGAWDDLVWLRDRCRTAAEDMGRQLWGVAHFADYRIALDAPGELAATVVAPGSGRFTLGPLTEVVAQAHTFDELDVHLDASVRPIVAQERVLRGEDLAPVFGDVGTPDLPAWVAQPWEPTYRLPRYRADERLEGDPDAVVGRGAVVDADPDPRPMADVGHAGAIERDLARLVSAWVVESRGTVTTATASGGLAEVLGAVGLDRSEAWPLTVPAALLRLADAAASGGHRGRRRGGAAGRAAAWWVAATLAGLDDLSDPDELEFRLEELRWWALAVDEPSSVRLALAVEDPVGGWAAAIDAIDVKEPGEGAGEDDETPGTRDDDGG